MNLQEGLVLVEKAFDLCCGHRPNIRVGNNRLVIEGHWSLMVNDQGKWMLYNKVAIPEEVRKHRPDPKIEYDFPPWAKSPKPLEKLLPALLLQYAIRRVEAGVKQLENENA